MIQRKNKFAAILCMRNLLVSFDEFKDKELMTERDLQDYLSRYQDLHDEWRRMREAGESRDIIDDDVMSEWHDYVVKQREELQTIITEDL